MPQTTNLGLPLWGESPPDGATGLDLRKAIIGENEDSMAQILDAMVERLANKVTVISDEPTDEQYPTVKAVKEYAYGKDQAVAEALNTLEKSMAEADDQILKDAKSYTDEKLSSGSIAVEQVQADFMEVDQNAPSFIKNKIVGYKADIVPESTWEFVSDSSWGYPLGDRQALEDNVDYIVTWDGVDYECTSTTFQWKSPIGGTMGLLAIGNPELFQRPGQSWTLISGAANNLPFFISGLWSFAKSGGDHNIRIRLADNIIRLDTQFLPDLRSDWNQTDDTQPDYIKNKPHIPTLPHYTKVASTGNYNDLGCKPYGEIVILSEKKISFRGGNGLFVSNNIELGSNKLIQAQDALVPGEQYVVIWDGTEYILTAGDVADFYEDANGVAYVGNQALFFGGNLGSPIDSGEPFIVLTANGTELTIFADSVDSVGTHTVSIYPVTNKIRKIDRKYLPDEMATKEYVEESIPKDYATAQSVEEIARQLAAILPAFTSADEGKVLGIKNGKLAWVKVHTSQADEPAGMDATVDGNVLVLGDGAYVDGNVLVLGDGVSVDGNTLVFSGETEVSDAAEVNGTVLAFNDDTTVLGNTLVLDSDASVDGTTLILGG